MPNSSFRIAAMIAVTSLLTFGAGSAHSQTGTGTNQQKEKPKPQGGSGGDAASTQEQSSQGSGLGSLGLGVGIGVSRLSQADILTTTVKNKTLFVTDSEDVKRGIWLETHYLLDRFKLGPYTSHGPFFGVQAAGDTSVINAVAFGYMLSLKRTPIGSAGKAAFNFGLGMYTTKIKVLANGFADSAPLPEGFEEALLRTRTMNGLMAMFSFSVF